MSVSKQIGLGFFIILTTVFISLFWLNLKNTEAYIEIQLASHAQDTATSLGLSLSPHVGDENSLPIVETMIQAIYDRGYYKSIVLFDNQDTTVLTFNENLGQPSVPEWFIRLVNLTPPVAETVINNGWNIQGKLAVSSNLNVGYEKLYSVAVKSMVIMMVSLIATIAFLWILMNKIVVRPLNDMFVQANAISKQKFDIIEQTPSTPEFARIVGAMNTMSQKLAKMFSFVTKQSEQYREYAYIDDLTQLGNRRAFQLAFAKLLEDKQSKTNGHMLIVRAISLGVINRKQGANYGNDYLVKISELISTFITEIDDEIAIYRINGADFAILLEESDSQKVSFIGDQLIQASKRIDKNEYEDGCALIGGAAFCNGDDVSLVMSKADSALTAALETHERRVILTNEMVGLSNNEWRERIQTLIEQQHAEFVVQPIIDVEKNQTLYCEWYARLPDKCNSVNSPMNQLIPASIKLDYIIEIDKMIITNLLKTALESEHDIGLNVSRISFLDGEFQAWLKDLLSRNKQVASKLILEIPERTLFHDVGYLCTFCEELKVLGVKICIEHFGAQLAGITHLRKLMPEFIKLDGRYIRKIDSEKDNQLFVTSLLNIADSLSIQTIAEMVETQSEFDWLKDTGVQTMQGYFISSPE